MPIVPWRCDSGVNVSSAMLESLERLHEAGKLVGGVHVEPTTDDKTYAYLIRHGQAELHATGFESGEAYVRWDGATRASRSEKYGYPPRSKGLPD